MQGNRIFYSFPKSQRGNMFSQSHNNGPGSYFPQHEPLKNADPHWSFGKQERNDFKAEPVPGPGQYENPTGFKRILGKFGNSQRNFLPDQKVPGPGNYENKTEFEVNLDKKKGTSFFQKYNPSGLNQVPGPQDYQHNSVFQDNLSKKRGTTFSKSLKSNDLQLKKEALKPGPGNYQNDVSQLQTKGGKFGKESRDGMKQSEEPGPGQYNIPFRVGKEGPNYSIRPKYQQPNQKGSEGVPGPGQYEDQFANVRNKESKWTFGKDKRAKSHNESGGDIGPGSYHIEREKGKKLGKFGKSSRQIQRDQTVPGPGNYEVNHSTLV